MSPVITQRIIDQMRKAGLPQNGPHAFIPRLAMNRSGRPIIEKGTVTIGPKGGKLGYVDVHGRIWVRDRSHGGLPDHWDVQIDGAGEYIRVDQDGSELP